MSNSKYLEPGWVRLYITIGGFLILAVLWYAKLDAHTANRGKHMSERETVKIVEMKSGIERNVLEIRRVEIDLKADMKELKTDMLRNFDEVKELIRNN